MTRALVVVLALACCGPAMAAGSARQAFVDAWVGRHVVVRSPIHSLVFNERGRLGTTRRGLREGLTVATASGASYLEFAGRQGRDTVVQTDAGRVLGAVNAAYDADVLDVRTYRKLEALSVSRYDPGAGLVVVSARVDGDLVRLDLANARGESPVTSLRVKWPLPISPSFEEREVVEAVIATFLTTS